MRFMCPAVLVVVLAGCGGGATAAKPLPKIEITPELAATGITFGEWKWNHLDVPSAVASLPEDAKGPVSAEVMAYDADGVRLPGGSMSLDGLEPGGKFEAAVYGLDPRAVRVVLGRWR